MKNFLLGVEQNPKGDKITLTYCQENSLSKTTFDADIFPANFFNHVHTISEEFKKLCVLGNTNYAISGFKVRDLDEGSRQEIQFIVNIKSGTTYFENAKTKWREMRDMPLEIFKGEDSQDRREAEAMNCIIAVFNAFQDYVSENLGKWLQIESNQMSLFDAPFDSKMLNELVEQKGF